MRRITAGAVLATGVLAFSGTPVVSQEQTSEAPASARIDQTTLPDAIDQKGARPQADPSVLPPAATELPQGLQTLGAPPSLALPNQPAQVRIRELRPLTLEEVLQLAEVNSPALKAAASQVDQAKSSLRAAISLWYPTIDLSANGLPQYFKSYTYQNPDFVPDRIKQQKTGQVNPFTGEDITVPVRKKGKNEFYGREWRTDLNLQVSWDIIDPARVPQIAAARDIYERVRA
ncbi:MAG: TolC family protein, partial [Synechococcus sp. BS307-5m-G38]|nr:TolC family protein [Synechococcus sp. BS307-5m-G38]